MYVTNLKACTLSSQPTRAQCGNTSLVCDLRQRIILIHELRQLARTKKLFDGSGNRLGVDDILRHQAFAFDHTESFTHSTLNTNQSDAKDVLGHFANATDSAVSEMVDIIDDALTVSNINQTLQHIHDVVFVENTRTRDFFSAKTTIEFHASDS